MITNSGFTLQSNFLFCFLFLCISYLLFNLPTFLLFVCIRRNVFSIQFQAEFFIPAVQWMPVDVDAMCKKRESPHCKKEAKNSAILFFSLTVLQAVSSTWSQKKAELFIFQSETPTEILSDIPAFFLLMFFRLEDGHFYLKWKKCFKLNNILKVQGKGGSIN